MNIELDKQNKSKAKSTIIQNCKHKKNSNFAQKYHFAPLTGWMNDPNGFVYFENQYHLFYQYNPFSGAWDTMHWGHAVSADLINWKHLDIALAPSEVYDNSPRGGCFSGTALYENDELIIMYTGVASKNGEFSQVQCLAKSTKDGFVKSDSNPIIKCPDFLEKNLFRDPKIIKKNNTYYCFLGTSLNGKGTSILYQSTDLINWVYRGPILDINIGIMWECPDIVFFGENDEKAVLLFSPMHYGYKQAIYISGKMDFESGKFTVSYIGETDRGFDFYAAQALKDNKGKIYCIGWMNSWDWMPWFTGFGKTEDEGFCGNMSIPRELILTDDNKLICKPVNNISLLEKDILYFVKNEVVDSMYENKFSNMPKSVKIQLSLTYETSENIEIKLYFKENFFKYNFNIKNESFIFSRDNIDGYLCGTKTTDYIYKDNNLLLDIYLDCSSMEMFLDDGSVVSSLMFNENSFDKIQVKCDNFVLNKLEITSLSNCKFDKGDFENE